MIKSQDRRGWFGASDTATIMSDWRTATFQKWFAEKLGLRKNSFTNSAMKAGTHWEHRIAEHLPEKVKLDRQVKLRKYRLRVNLDAESKDTIYEIKTRSKAWHSLPTHYWMQVQVQMYATGKREAYVAAYTLEPEDYDNYYREFEPSRLQLYKVRYDETFIKNSYIPRIEVLCKCLRKGIMPQGELWKSYRKE